MKRILTGILLLLVVVALGLAGCATTRGVGQDIKSLGQGIEDAAN